MRKEKEDKKNDQTDTHSQVALVGIYVNRPESPLIAECISVPGRLLCDRLDHGTPCGARSGKKILCLMEYIPRASEKHQYRREEERGAAGRQKDCQRAQKSQSTSHAEDRRNIDRPYQRESESFQITGQEIEHEVILDIVSGEVRILCREIRTDTESGSDRHVRRKIAEDRESQTDIIAAHVAGIEIYEADSEQDQTGGNGIERDRSRVTVESGKLFKVDLLRVSVVSKEASLPEEAAEIREDTHAHDIGRQEVRGIRRDIGMHDIRKEIGDPGCQKKTDEGTGRKQEKECRYFFDDLRIRGDTDVQTTDIRDQETDQLCAKENGYDQIKNGKHIATSTYLYPTIIPLTRFFVTNYPTLSLQILKFPAPFCQIRYNQLVCRGIFF